MQDPFASTAPIGPLQAVQNIYVGFNKNNSKYKFCFKSIRAELGFSALLVVEVFAYFGCIVFAGFMGNGVSGMTPSVLFGIFYSLLCIVTALFGLFAVRKTNPLLVIPHGVNSVSAIIGAVAFLVYVASWYANKNTVEYNSSFEAYVDSLAAPLITFMLACIFFKLAVIYSMTKCIVYMKDKLEDQKCQNAMFQTTVAGSHGHHTSNQSDTVHFGILKPFF